MTPSRHRLAGAVMAAGGASRFSGPKQVARVAGETLVAQAARAALRHCDAGVMVVTGAHAGRVREAILHLNVRAIHHPDWAEGLGTTVEAAIAAAPACEGLLVMTCDQPGVDGDALAVLVEAWRRVPQRPAAAVYAGVLGVPAILPMPRARELRLAAERGAQAALMSWPGGCTRVPMAAAGFDIDSPEDLASLSPDDPGRGRDA